MRSDYSTVAKSQTQIQGIVNYNTQAPSKFNNDPKELTKVLPIKPKAQPAEPVRQITKTIPREPKLDIKQDLKPQKSETGARFKEPNTSHTPQKYNTQSKPIQPTSNQHITNPKETAKQSTPTNPDSKKKSEIFHPTINEQDEPPRKNSKSRVFTGFAGSETKIQLELESFRHEMADPNKPQSKVDDLMQAKLENLKKKSQAQLTPIEKEMLKMLAKKK
jgi:hypothetical protein